VGPFALIIISKTVNTFKTKTEKANYYEFINNHWKNLEIKFSPYVYRPEEETNLSRRVQGDN
jgi:hypothetical protein